MGLHHSWFLKQTRHPSHYQKRGDHDRLLKVVDLLNPNNKRNPRDGNQVQRAIPQRTDEVGQNKTNESFRCF